MNLDNFPADKDALMACTLADGRTVEAADAEAKILSFKRISLAD